MKKVNLTEEDLHSIIENSILSFIAENVITEDVEEEGFWNQLKQGAKSFMGNGYGADKENNYRNTTADRQARGENTANWLNKTTPMNLKQRWNAAKTGWKEQGKIDNIDQVAVFLNDMIKKGKIKPETTVGQLIQQGKFAKGGNLNQMRNQSMSKVSKANNDIYRGMNQGVMGSGKHTQI